MFPQTVLLFFCLVDFLRLFCFYLVFFFCHNLGYSEQCLGIVTCSEALFAKPMLLDDVLLPLDALVKPAIAQAGIP